MHGRSGTVSGPRSEDVAGTQTAGVAIAPLPGERGIGGVVVDRSDVAAGTPWGNAGRMSPEAAPLSTPSALREGLRPVADPAATPLAPAPAGTPRSAQALTLSL